MNAEQVRHETGVLLIRHETEPEHTLHVSRLACLLFDGLIARHGLNEADRLLLECAAALHDIGWAVTQPDGKAHHKASARMIREFPWTSLERHEVQVVAMVARYHRKALPTLRHPDYVALPPETQSRVGWLAGFLRLADGLDRRHLQAVSTLEVRSLPDSVDVLIFSDREVGTELVAGRKKADLLEAACQSPLRLIRVEDR
jgi:exopolyphosphatase/guanosine-5'-triphosphate,3'-diphosphate pyrophosphatase